MKNLALKLIAKVGSILEVPFIWLQRYVDTPNQHGNLPQPNHDLLATQLVRKLLRLK